MIEVWSVGEIIRHSLSRKVLSSYASCIGLAPEAPCTLALSLRLLCFHPASDNHHLDTHEMASNAQTENQHELVGESGFVENAAPAPPPLPPPSKPEHREKVSIALKVREAPEGWGFVGHVKEPAWDFLTPPTGKYFFYWGECLRREGKPQAAVTAFEQALERPYTAEDGDLYLFKQRLAKVELGHDEVFNAELASHLKQPPVGGEWLLLAAAQDFEHQAYASAGERLKQATDRLPSAVYAAITHDYLFQAQAKRSEVATQLDGTPTKKEQKAVPPKSAPQPEARELLCAETAELHFFDFPSGSFVQQDVSVTATVTEVGNWQYWLQVNGKDREWLGIVLLISHFASRRQGLAGRCGGRLVRRSGYARVVRHERVTGGPQAIEQMGRVGSKWHGMESKRRPAFLFRVDTEFYFFL